MLIRSMTLKNILSFRDATLELRNLNVLIGPNASGKSNFLEVIDLLHSAPKDLTAPLSRGGGVREWCWKGQEERPQGFKDSSGVECLLQPPATHTRSPMSIRYVLRFAERNQGVAVVQELMENERPHGGEDKPFFYFSMQQGAGKVSAVSLEDSAGGTRRKRDLQRGEVKDSQSVLSALRDKVAYPEITYYAKVFGEIRLYREWNMGRRGAPRLPQQTDLSNDFLNENADNLVLVLNRMDTDGHIGRVEEHLSRFCDRFRRPKFKIHGGTVQLLLEEQGLAEPVPATRLSDGTLRLLCLLSVLCHPSPPPLICIEEPELGLHPDSITIVAEALVEASERTQLIVTTHSDALVDALSDRPESVVVCEHDQDQGTSFRRLEKAALDAWLEEYTLGRLWRKGEIGGNRW